MASTLTAEQKKERARQYAKDYWARKKAGNIAGGRAGGRAGATAMQSSSPHDWRSRSSSRIPHLTDDGTGVHRSKFERERERERQLPCQIPCNIDKGVHRRSFEGGRNLRAKYPSSETTVGAHTAAKDRISFGGFFDVLAARLRRVRVCCGNWSRVCTPSVTSRHGLTAVLLDPPYDPRHGCDRVYAHNDESVSAQVRKWALEHGDDPLFRIALCGLDSEHKMPKRWECVAWKGAKGYGNNDNRHRERIWFSPHCLKD